MTGKETTSVKYFVMLNHPGGYPVLMTVSGYDSSPMLFDSEEQADEGLSNHSAAQAWGYVLYPWPPWEVERG